MMQEFYKTFLVLDPTISPELENFPFLPKENEVVRINGSNQLYKIVSDGRVIDTYNINSPEDMENVAVLMQSTDLKDKNGVEIFDGDIVVVYDEDSQYEPFVYEAVYSKDKLAWMFRDMANEEDYWLSTCSWDELEVIGNIWENPELLEVSHAQ